MCIHLTGRRPEEPVGLFGCCCVENCTYRLVRLTADRGDYHRSAHSAARPSGQLPNVRLPNVPARHRGQGRRALARADTPALGTGHRAGLPRHTLSPTGAARAAGGCGTGDARQAWRRERVSAGLRPLPGASATRSALRELTPAELGCTFRSPHTIVATRRYGSPPVTA